MFHLIEFTIASENYPSTAIFEINGEFIKGLNVSTNSDQTIDQVIKFSYDYPTDSNNTLTIRFEKVEEEAEVKMLSLRKILINNQQLYVQEGDYNPYPNDYVTLKDTIEHGGNMGWYGTMDYEFNIQDNLSNNRISNSSIDKMSFGHAIPRTILRDASLQKRHHLND